MLPNGHSVKIDDEWCEMQCTDADIKHGWIKAKHVSGRLAPGTMSKLKDAGGNGSAMVRKECKQEEGKNSQGFIDDDTVVKVIRHWVEITWEGAGAVKAGKGFVETECLPENDVILQGKLDDCMSAAKELETELGGVQLLPKKLGIVKDDAAGKGIGRG